MNNSVTNQSSLRIALAALTLPMLVACGGGGGGGSSDNSPAVSGTSSSPVAPVDNVAEETREIDGGAIKGVIREGIVTAYATESLAGRVVQTSKVVGKVTRTNSSGTFRLSIPRQYAGTLVVEISADSSTRMRCDVVDGCEVNGPGNRVAFGAEFPLSNSFRLRGAVDTSSQSKVFVTPMSHLAVAKAAAMTDGLSTSNVSSAYRAVETDFGVAAGSLNNAPADLTKLSDTSTAASIELGVLNAAFLSLVSESTWNNIGEVLADASARIVADGDIPAVSASTEISLESLLYAAQDIAVDLGNTTTSTALAATLDTVSTGVATTYTTVVGEDSTEVVDSGSTGSTDSSSGSTSGSTTDTTTGSGSTSGSTSGTGSSTGTDSGTVADTGSSTGTDTGSTPDNGATSGTGSSTDTTTGTTTPPVLSARLSWTAPLTRENGESLTMSDIKGYVIVYGSASGNLDREIEINDAYTTQYEITDLQSGQWYFAVRTVDSTGLESKPSGTVTKTL